MYTIRTLLTLAALLASSLTARTAPEEVTLVGMQLDGSGVLHELRPTERKDLRDNIALFGHTPTLVVVASHIGWDEDDTNDYVKSIRKVDKVAAKWRKDGFDVVFIEPPAHVERPGYKYESLELVRRAKPKQMYCGQRVIGEVYPLLEPQTLDVLLDNVYTSELAFRWFLIGELGVVTAAGEDVFADELSDLRETLIAPSSAENSSTRRIFAAINEWRIGDAESALEKLENGSAAERHADAIDELRGMLERSASYYRSVFVDPYAERGCLVEAAQALERYASQFAEKGAIADATRAELEELRASTEYQRAREQHDAYVAILAAYDEMESETSRLYDRAVGNTDGFDEAEYDRAIREVYPATIAELRAYLESNGDSPYARPVKEMLVTAQEDLTYAQ